jgi:hypothetical protein
VIALCHRFASLDRLDRQLVLEVVALMPLVWAGLHLFRFPTLRCALETYVRSRTVAHTGSEAEAMDRVRWAITVVAARFPRATCLVQALTADTILRRMGLECALRIGVRASGTGTVPIEAHAWVDCNGRVAIGAIEELSDFRVLAAPRSA